MRLLILNANTSDVVTAKVEAGARAAASPGTSIVAVRAASGPNVIGTRAENALAGAAAVELAVSHAASVDAIVIGVSYDTGLGALRELLSIPVVGMTEAALLTACMLGGRIGIITFGERVLPMYRELVDLYGLGARIAGWRTIESAAAYQAGAHDELDRTIVARAVELVEQDGAEVIVLTGAVMAGVPARLQGSVPVPMLDGITAGVRQAELLVRAAYPKPQRGSYAPPGARQFVNTPAAIVDAFARSTKPST